MAAPKISLAQAKRRIRAIETALKAGYRPPGVTGGGLGAIAAAAQAIRPPIHRATLAQQLPWLKRVYGLEPDWSLWRKPNGATGRIAPAEDRRTRRQADQVAQLTARLRSAERELNAQDDLRQAVLGLAQQPLDPPKWTVTLRPARKGPGVPLLFASDFQWGETVSASEMDGINAFSVAIAKQRYRRLIERAIDLCHSHMVRPDYPGIIYVRGGDMVSGEIHQELRETNELQSIPAVDSLVEEEIAGIGALRRHFRRVYVVTVPGNHGRTTIKPFSKRYAQTNYDTLSAWMIERWFRARGEKGVTFHTPPSGDAFVPVLGWNFLITHGDRIGSRGGQGFIGPAATVARGMKKLLDFYAQLGKSIDYILMGHFHTRLELEYGFVNGSLPGSTEYSRDGRMSPKPPEQWLLFVHEQYGVTARWPILLESRPRLAPAAAAGPFGTPSGTTGR